MYDIMAFQSNANNAWIFNGNNGNLNYNNNRINTNAARVFRDSRREPGELDEPVIALPELYHCYYKNRRGKRRRNSQLEFERDYPDHLRRMCYELNNFEYIIRKVMAFMLNYPQQREVIFAIFYDRVPQYWFCETLRPGVEKRLDPASYACRIGRGPLAAALQLAEYVGEVSRAGKVPTVIAKEDQKSFFLHINRETLVEDLNEAIREDFAENPRLRDLLLYLCRVLYLSDTISHAVRCCPVTEWEGLPKYKSRFNLPPMIGLDIGNQPSQLGAAYKSRRYLRAFRDYGYNRLVHYSDDTICVMEADRADQFHRLFLPYLRQVEAAEGLELNEKKHYCQDARHGVSAFGFFIKLAPDGAVLMLPSKRIVHNLENKLRKWIERAEGDLYFRLAMKERFCSSVNSYFSIFRHCNAYRLRKRFANQILASCWSDVIMCAPDYTHIAVKPGWTRKAYYTRKNRQFKHQILHYHDQATSTAD